jgi:hypothetical protein
MTNDYLQQVDRHFGFPPETTSLVANGNEKISRKREGTKGPVVLPAVKDVDRMHPISLPFESSGS